MVVYAYAGIPGKSHIRYNMHGDPVGLILN